MRSRDNLSVRFELLGGLGNQLFQWVAAVYYKRISNDSAEIDLTYCSTRFKMHGSSILELRFESEFVLPVTKIRESRFTYFVEQLAYRFWMFNKARNWIQGRYVPNNNGYVENLVSDNRRILRGYFQTYRYLEAISQRPLKVSISDESATSTIMVDPLAVAIHIRQGDYLALKDTFGVLSNEYYLKALDKLKEKITPSQIVIFSNDTEAAQSLAARIGANARVFKDTLGVSDLSTLLILSRYQYLISANSSYSWWAAMLNCKKTVIYPEPWFKALEQPLDLIPPYWISCPASWLD